MLHILGDSKVVIGWILGISNLNVLLLSHWKNIILELNRCYSSIYFSHVYREFNFEADEISKKVVVPLEDFILFEEFLDGEILDSGNLFLFLDE